MELAHCAGTLHLDLGTVANNSSSHIVLPFVYSPLLGDR